MDLLLGFKQTTGGEILINGSQLKIDGFSSNIKSWHNLVSIFPQEIYLIDDTIANNISLAQENDNSNLSNIRESAKIACIDDFISNLPSGYNTFVGENGITQVVGNDKELELLEHFLKVSF